MGELAPPVQQTFEDDAEHTAMPARKGTHDVMTKREDTLYTKFLCCKFGLDNDSKVLGPAVCGLEKEDPFIVQLHSCELNAPMLECGNHCKCFPVKLGLDIEFIENKCAKPLIVFCGKDIV